MELFRDTCVEGNTHSYRNRQLLKVLFGAFKLDKLIPIQYL
jgi:hypothetical protein